VKAVVFKDLDRVPAGGDAVIASTTSSIGQQRGAGTAQALVNATGPRESLTSYSARTSNVP
jgi:hypothetical protein